MIGVEFHGWFVQEDPFTGQTCCGACYREQTVRVRRRIGRPSLFAKTERNRQVVEMKKMGVPLKEIATHFGISKVRVQQICEPK